MPTSNPKLINRLLWTAQILCALVFLFAGSSKFLMPPEKMQQGPVVLPLAFLYFIGTCECLGALGLILPGVTKIRPSLTPLAAMGLTIIMIGAVVVTIIGMGVAPAIFPGVIGMLTAWIAYGRTRLVPLEGRASQRLSVNV